MNESTLHGKHIYRAFGLVLMGCIGFLVFRGLALPDGFGEFGHYDPADLEIQKNVPVSFMGREECKKCHHDHYDTVMTNGHKGVQCENCHDPISEHIKDGVRFQEMKKPRDATLCLRCHEYFVARPASHPQVDAVEHVRGMGMSLGNEEVCVMCHNPHTPSLKPKAEPAPIPTDTESSHEGE